MLHGLDLSKGPINISYILKLSAPYFPTTSSGFTTFPLDLLIFCPSSPPIIPWLNNFLNGSFVETNPRSYKTWCQNLEYNKCNTACSTPPTYRSTGIQYFSFSGFHASFSFKGSINRRKYQQEPAHCGIVLVSLFPISVFTHSSIPAKGDSPVPVGSYLSTSGSVRGRSDSFNGIFFPPSPWIIGIGSPQYRCREKSQSLSLYCTFLSPFLFASSHSIAVSIASGTFSPFRSKP